MGGMQVPSITIDQHTFDVPAGTNLVEAAKLIGVEIPTLCYLKGYEPSTSCQLCTVKDRASGRLVPACATIAQEGLQIDNETDEIFEIRRTALELLMSEHVGDCRAPCDFACPAHMDIPLMLQQISDEALTDAVATVKDDIAMPAVLGRVCPKPCEKGCRRRVDDGPVAICDLKRYVADVDLQSDDPYLPTCNPDSGKRVAVIGSGPTGLAAAYYLRRAGHACTLIEKSSELGGRLRTEESVDVLPRQVLDAEIAQVIRLGVEVQREKALDSKASLDAIASDYDAVLIAIGKCDPVQVQELGLRSNRKGFEVDRNTYSTNRRGVFAAGVCLRGKNLVVRSVADGKEVAHIIDQFVRGQKKLVPYSDFSSRIESLQPREVGKMLEHAGDAQRDVPEKGTNYDLREAAMQSERCFECACESHGKCKLEYWCIQYDANPTRFPRVRQDYEVLGRESSVLFEPGKCIKCELCIKIAEKAQEPLGLTFVGRGFDVVVDVPFQGEVNEGLQKVANDVVEACPTAALSFAESRRIRHPDIFQIENQSDTMK